MGQGCQECVADLEDALVLARLREHMQERLVDLGSQLGVHWPQFAGSLEGYLRGRQRALRQRFPARVEKQRRCSGLISGHVGKLGRQLAPFALESWVGCFHQIEQVRCQAGALRRQQFFEDCRLRERMPELESAALSRQ